STYTQQLRAFGVNQAFGFPAFVSSAAVVALFPPYVTRSGNFWFCLESELGYWPSGDSQAWHQGQDETTQRRTE
ncbi:hypothetical protein, partial [Nostoc sp. NZL]|uniref:hypothetical protein n=1 Tax=Nostoc sp. NZL TaxID=2650612 RepID=UPI001E3C8476